MFSGHQPLLSSATMQNGSAAVPLFHQQQQQQQQFRQQAPQQQMPFSSSPAGVLPHPASLAPSQSLPGEHLPHWQQQQQASQLLRMPSGNGGGGAAFGGAGFGSNEYLNQLGIGALGGAPQQAHPAARGASGELSEDLLFRYPPSPDVPSRPLAFRTQPYISPVIVMSVLRSVFAVGHSPAGGTPIAYH